jgi:hypothetical protein
VKKMSADAEILAVLRRGVLAPKRLAVEPIWKSQPHKSTSLLRLVAALEIDGVAQEGLYLHGRTLQRTAARDLTFSLYYEYAHVGHNLTRVDWRPKRPHTDTIGGINERKSFAGSNWHSFDDNAAYGLSALQSGIQGNLPRAVPLDPDPPNVKALLQIIKHLMNIENIEEIPDPPWDTQGSLL